MRAARVLLPVGLGLALLTAHADAASQNTSPQGDSWASIANLPDWRGVWDLDWSSFNGSSATGEKPPRLTPEYARRLASYQEAQKLGAPRQAPTANCVPPGMPAIMAQPFPIEFLFTPGKVTVVIEAYGQTRRIFTDGRPHPADPDPTYQGHSIGHWEGDTLVVDTIGILPETQLAPGVGHSDRLRIEERIRRGANDVIEIRMKLHDPEALQEPLELVRRYKHQPDWDIKEYVCAQNNRDGADAEGRGFVDLKK